jgi:hypothetical protein
VPLSNALLTNAIQFEKAKVSQSDGGGFSDWACVGVRKCVWMWYRLVNKYMRQLGLMTMHRTFIYNFLSSDVAFIPFTYFLNSLYPSLKYSIQFFLIHIPQNGL